MNVNFTVFIDKILSGEKRQTIRKAGKKWENVKVGDKLTLYTGLRTKECRKLGEAEVKSIEDIKLYIEYNHYRDTYYTEILIDNKIPTDCEINKLVKADGFRNIYYFLKFFQDHYGNNFKGKIIKWKKFRKAE